MHKIMIVGGPDVDLRLELMTELKKHFELIGVGSNPSLNSRFIQAGFEYYSFPMTRTVNPINDIKSIFALYHLFRRKQPTIVHLFDTKPSIVGRLAAKLARVPIVICTITGLGTLYLTNTRKIIIIRNIYEQIQKVLQPLADLFIFYNPSDASYFMKRGMVIEKKIAIIPGSGVSIHRFDPENITPEEKVLQRQKLGLLPKQVVVIMVSRLVRSKGVLIYHEVACLVKSMLPEVCFLLVGPEDHKSMDGLTLDEIHSLSPDVKWIGPSAEVEKLFAISDICVLPTEREGIPRVLVEAGAAGLPLITHQVPGCTEVVENEVNGLLVEPGNIDSLVQAIVLLATNTELRFKYGKVARELVINRFSLEAITKSISTIYWRMLT